MANRSRIQIAKQDIVQYFDEQVPHVLKYKELAKVLSRKHRDWRLATSTTTSDFIGFLIKHAKLRKLEFTFPTRPETLYVWGSVPTLEALLHLRNQIYYSHYTAVRIHGLTEQVPSTIYLTDERTTPVQEQDSEEVSQEDIDESFSRPPRMSNNVAQLEDRRIYILSGANTGRAGVVTQEANYGSERNIAVRVTNLERTLIDCVVRPFYCGGASEVAKAFQLAKDRVSVNTLVAMVKRLRFRFPYHQAIGFYMTRAGYRQAQIDLVRGIGIRWKFYLAHELRNARLDKEWQLYVPQGF